MKDSEQNKLIDSCVPGEIKKAHISGAGPGAPGYAAVASQLGETYYISFLAFYDPHSEAPPEAQYDVAPCVEGIVVRYREEHRDALSAGVDFGFFESMLLQEGSLQNGDNRTGLDHIEKRVSNRNDRLLAQRLYDHPELTDDPDYKRELKRKLAERVPDEQRREALESFARFSADHE